MGIQSEAPQNPKSLHKQQETMVFHKALGSRGHQLFADLHFTEAEGNEVTKVTGSKVSL